MSFSPTVVRCVLVCFAVLIPGWSARFQEGLGLIERQRRILPFNDFSGKTLLPTDPPSIAWSNGIPATVECSRPGHVAECFVAVSFNVDVGIR